MKHLMIDIETLATPRQLELVPIWSISIVAFDLDHNEIDVLDQLVHPKTCLDLDAKINLNTLTWLMKQNDEVRNHFIKSTEEGEDISYVLDLITKFINEHKPEYIWANDPDFDLSILQSYYLTLNKVIPWSYSLGKSVRTIKMLLVESGYNCKNNLTHLSYEDCLDQIDIIKAYNKIKL